MSAALAVTDCDAFTVEVYPDREAWKAARMKGLGGSDAPVLWDVSKHDARFSLYHEKRGNRPRPDDTEDREWLVVGTLMEPVIAQLYELRTGRAVSYPGPTTILRSRRWPFMHVSLDRVVDDPASGRGFLECKNRFVGESKNWRESLPEDVGAQMVHAFAVTQFGWGAAAAIIGGNTFRYLDVEHHRELVDEHVRRCEALWNDVQAGREPDASGHDADGRALKALYPREEDGACIALDADDLEVVLAYETAKADEHEAERLKKQAENLLRQRLGAAGYGQLPDGRVLQLLVEARKAERCSDCGAIVRNATEPRVLRLKKGVSR